MTLNVALHGRTVDNECFIVVCSDSRGTIYDKDGGTHAFDDLNKIIKLNDHAALLISGLIDAAMTLVESFVNEHKDIPEDFDKLLEDFKSHCAKIMKAHFYGIPMDQWPLFEFILAGIDKKGESRIYVMCSHSCFFPYKKDRYCCSGSDMLGDYIFSKNYESDKNDYSKLLKLAIFAVYESKQITDVGGKIKAAIIDDADGYIEQNTEEFIDDIKDYRFFDEGDYKEEMKNKKEV